MVLRDALAGGLRRSNSIAVCRPPEAKGRSKSSKSSTSSVGCSAGLGLCHARSRLLARLGRARCAVERPQVLELVGTQLQELVVGSRLALGGCLQRNQLCAGGPPGRTFEAPPVWFALDGPGGRHITRGGLMVELHVELL